MTSCDVTNDAATTTNARGHFAANEQRLHFTDDCSSTAHVVVPTLLLSAGHARMCVHYYSVVVVVVVRPSSVVVPRDRECSSTAYVVL